MIQKGRMKKTVITAGLAAILVLTGSLSLYAAEGRNIEEAGAFKDGMEEGMNGGKPAGDPPDAPPGGGGSSSSVTWSGNTEITSAAGTSGETYSSTNADENALLVNTSENVTLINPTVNKSGGTSASDAYSFYGINSAVMVKGGGTTEISGAKITTEAAGANGVFSYGANNGSTNATGDGTTVVISDSTITTTEQGSGGIMTTYGGTTNATNLTIETSGGSSAPIRTDRGGGWVTVNGGSYTSNGKGSPAIYSTADVKVSNADLTSNASEGVCIEGNGSIALKDCTLTASNTEKNGNAQYNDTIMIYQSMSGDATGTGSVFSMTGGKLISKYGHVFHVTNTGATINLSGVTIENQDSENVLLSVTNDGWSGNSNTAVLNATGQTLAGQIIVSDTASSKSDSESSLSMKLDKDSTFVGSIGDENKSSSGMGTVTVTMDGTWTLTADSYVSSISGSGTINYGSYKLTVGKTSYTAENPCTEGGLNGGSGSSVEEEEEEPEKVSVSSGRDSRITIVEGQTTTAGNTKTISYESEMVKGQKYTFGNGSWVSEDPGVISVVKKTGAATAKKAGKTILVNTVESSGQTVSYKYTITVHSPVLKTDGIRLLQGSEEAISISDTGNMPITWVSSNPAVVSVTADATNGNTASVKALGTGSASVMAYVGGKAYGKKLTVKNLNWFGRLETNDGVAELDLTALQSWTPKFTDGFSVNKAVWSKEDGTRLSQDAGGVWTDEDGIVSITKAGRITGTGTGSVTLKASSAADPAATKTIKVTVTARPVRSVVYINVGQSAALKHSNVKNGAKWTVDDTDSLTLHPATVSKATVRFTGKKAGSTVLKCEYSGITYETKVIVEDPSLKTDSRLEQAKASSQYYTLKLKTGESYKINTEYTEQDIFWRSSNPAFVFADESGTLEARGSAGQSALVSAKINNKTVKIKVSIV